MVIENRRKKAKEEREEIKIQVRKGNITETQQYKYLAYRKSGTRDAGPGTRDPTSGPGTRDPYSGTRDPGPLERDPGPGTLNLICGTLQRPLERDPGPGTLNLICGTLQSSKILQTRNAVYGHDNNGLNKHKPQWKELRIFLLFLWTLPGSDNRWY